MANCVTYTASDGIAIFTLNRPDSRNAISLELAEELATFMDAFDSDPLTRVGILTGGPNFFSSGMDLKGFARGELPYIDGKGFAGFVECPPTKPLIAAVEGFALAGGFEMVLACDLIVASNTAIFGLPEVTKGITAASGGLLRLPKRIPHHLAMELILTGSSWSAKEAFRFGLVNRLAEKGQTLAVATDLAQSIAGNAPLAVVASKEVVSRMPDWTASEAFSRQFPIIDPIRRSKDAAEGSRAYIEKRPPIWVGE